MSDQEIRVDCRPKLIRGYRPFLLGILFLSLYLTYLILFPFIDSLILAIVLASIFHPLQFWLTRKYRGRKNLAALTIVFIITFAIAIPTFLFASALVSQGSDTLNRMNEWVKAGNLQKLTHDPRVQDYQEQISERFPFLDLAKFDIAGNLLQLSKDVGQFALAKTGAILGNVATLFTRFFIMIFIVFYLVRDGSEMMQRVRYYSPLRDDQEDRILGGVRRVARSVLAGIFVTAICQGIVGGIGMAIVGIPGLFWGTVMGFASLVPLIGTALVWVPAVGYLLLIGSFKSAIFLTLWCVLLVGSIDNFLRPFIMQGGSKMSMFYIFLAIIGGVQYFGFAGILYGPLILSFAMIMLFIYGVEFHEDLLSRDVQRGQIDSTPEL